MGKLRFLILQFCNYFSILYISTFCTNVLISKGSYHISLYGVLINLKSFSIFQFHLFSVEFLLNSKFSLLFFIRCRFRAQSSTLTKIYLHRHECGGHGEQRGKTSPLRRIVSHSVPITFIKAGIWSRLTDIFISPKAIRPLSFL